MTLAQFQGWIASHADEFRGVHPHAPAEFDGFERALGYALPESLRWLLGERGYSDFCGVGNLDEAVARTLECRTSIALPDRWLILNDWGDAGIVLLDLSSGRVCWCGTHNAAAFSGGEIDADAEWFAGYPEWVQRRFADAD